MGGDGERRGPRPPEVGFGLFALLDELADGAGAGSTLGALLAALAVNAGAGAGSTLGGAALAGAALDSFNFVSD